MYETVLEVLYFQISQDLFNGVLTNFALRIASPKKSTPRQEKRHMYVPTVPFAYAGNVLARARDVRRGAAARMPGRGDLASYGTDVLGLHPFAYVGGAAPRSFVQANVFTANESPPDAVIPLHHELAQASERPSHLVFYCAEAARSGGATVVVDSRKVAGVRGA